MLNGAKKYLRVIDANLNRAREGLRVIEDTARFVEDNAVAFTSIRAIRHALEKITRGIYPELLRHRDSLADSGRVIKEGKREGIKPLLSANFRRVEESLRVLEEYGKIVSPSAAPKFKKLRFQTYILEKQFLVKDKAFLHPKKQA